MVYSPITGRPFEGTELTWGFETAGGQAKILRQDKNLEAFFSLSCSASMSRGRKGNWRLHLGHLLTLLNPMRRLQAEWPTILTRNEEPRLLSLGKASSGGEGAGFACDPKLPHAALDFLILSTQGVHIDELTLHPSLFTLLLCIDVRWKKRELALLHPRCPSPTRSTQSHATIASGAATPERRNLGSRRVPSPFLPMIGTKSRTKGGGEEPRAPGLEAHQIPPRLWSREIRRLDLLSSRSK